MNGQITAMQALRQLARGTGVILRGLAWAGEWPETLARWVIAAIAGSLALTGACLHPWLWPVLALAWLAAATTAAPVLEVEDDQDDATEDVEDEDDEPSGDEQLLDADAFTELVHDVARGGNVHLSAVRARLADELPGIDWSGPAVTALCDIAGIPVRKGVRVPGATPAVTTGIHRSDLPPLPDPNRAAPVGVVAAGQRDNNNTNSVSVERIGEGAALVKTRPTQRQEIAR